MNPYAAVWHGITEPKKEDKRYSLYYRDNVILRAQPYPVCVAERKKRVSTNFQLTNFKIKRA